MNNEVSGRINLGRTEKGNKTSMELRLLFHCVVYKD